MRSRQPAGLNEQSRLRTKNTSYRAAVVSKSVEGPDRASNSASTRYNNKQLQSTPDSTKSRKARLQTADCMKPLNVGHHHLGSLAEYITKKSRTAPRNAGQSSDLHMGPNASRSFSTRDEALDHPMVSDYDSMLSPAEVMATSSGQKPC